MDKRFWGFLVVVALVLFGVFFISNTNKAQAPSTKGILTNHTEGKTNSNVQLVEYGDFQCPACKSYFPIVKELKADYADKVNFQFRHFPLVQLHPNAFVGSRAAEAAGKQGKFFEMHDLLYENQDTWSTSQTPNTVLEGYAQQLGLNVDQFKRDVNSSEVAAAINADVKAAQSIGGNSTPTFVLNNQKIEQNPRTVDAFKKLLDDAVNKAQ